MDFVNLSQSEIDELLKERSDAAEPQGKGAVRPLRKQVEEDEASKNAPALEAPNIGPAVFQELSTDAHTERPVAGMELLMDVPLSVSVELGKARCFLKDLLNLTIGSVVELDRAAGDPVDILVNGKPFALGEVVVIDENFGVRIREILHKKADKEFKKVN
ncbi:MAG TPA: flagellar motor switch protein FliN [Firmicutes bacterium]|nr:flagellar motor switch protein FliN [Candidatus Fermentithermobacillaceae bacterium]